MYLISLKGLKLSSPYQFMKLTTQKTDKENTYFSIVHRMLRKIYMLSHKTRFHEFQGKMHTEYAFNHNYKSNYKSI